MTSTAKVVHIGTMRRKGTRRMPVRGKLALVLRRIWGWGIVALVLVFIAAAYSKSLPKVQSVGLNRSVVAEMSRTHNFDATGH